MVVHRNSGGGYGTWQGAATKTQKRNERAVSEESQDGGELVPGEGVEPSREVNLARF